MWWIHLWTIVQYTGVHCQGVRWARDSDGLCGGWVIERLAGGLARRGALVNGHGGLAILLDSAVAFGIIKAMLSRGFGPPQVFFDHPSKMGDRFMVKGKLICAALFSMVIAFTPGMRRRPDIPLCGPRPDAGGVTMHFNAYVAAGPRQLRRTSRASCRCGRCPRIASSRPISCRSRLRSPRAAIA